MSDLLTDPKFAAVVAHFERACRASRLHSSGAARAFANYGDHGPLISGCVRDHFPDAVKDQLRTLARLVTTESDAARDDGKRCGSCRAPASRPKYPHQPHQPAGGNARRLGILRHVTVSGGLSYDPQENAPW